VTRIVEFQEGRGRLREWVGGWSEYEAARGRARANQYRRFEEAEGRRRGAEALLRERRGQARVFGGDADRRGTQALRSKVRQSERALERVDEVEKPFEPWRLRLELEPVVRSGDIVVRLEGAVVERGSFRLGPIELDLRWGDRVALSGPNGSGKSTLLAALLGTVPLAAGCRTIGRGVVVGELDQRRTLFEGEEPLVSAVPALAGLPPEEARTLLAKFGLGAEHVLRPAGTLSPGERTRAALALLMARGVNCLVLDEATNHLDLPAIEELEAALVDFPGTVVLITHDRRLLERFGPRGRWSSDPGLYSAANGRPEEEDEQVQARQAARHAPARGAAPESLPAVRAAEAAAQDVPELQDVRRPRDRTAPHSDAVAT
jgi:ATPase subunit of ABC transporter with duplicated ATPase domains